MRTGLRIVAVGVFAALVVPVGAGTPATARPSASPSPVPLERPTEAEASALARQTGQQVEVTGLRDEVQEVYANPTGTYTLATHAQPVRVRRGTGWTRVDTTLRQYRDGTVRPVATSIPMAFSGGGNAALARIDWRGKELALGWSGELPAPALDGETATYRDVLPDVDLVLSAGVLGFSEVVVVKTPQAARDPRVATLRLTMKLTGLRMRSDPAGNIGVLDESGTEVLHVGSPVAWDSAGAAVSPRERVTGPPDGAKRARVQVAVDAGGLALRAGSLLTDPDTRFPVYIDPNPSFGGARVAWTSVWKAHPDSSYYNSTDIARVGHEDQTGMTNRSFFRMDTTKVRGKHVLKGTFRTYEVWSWACLTAGHNQNVELWMTGRSAAEPRGTTNRRSSATSQTPTWPKATARRVGACRQTWLGGRYGGVPRS